LNLELFISPIIIGGIFLMLIVYFRYWKSVLNNFNTEDPSPKKIPKNSVSVLILFRNEESQLPQLLNRIQLCDSFEVPVVVDAAACFPARSNSWNFHSQAKFEVFSLHATKVFGIGEGGLVVGDDEVISDVRSKSNFGLVNGGNGFTDGLNAKADEFTASRALARFPMYQLDVSRRQDFVSAYQSILSTSESIKLIQENEFTVYSYFPLIFQTEESMLEFQQLISPFLTTRRYYFPTIKTGYRGDSKVYFSKNLDISEAIAPRILCLPVYFLYEPDLLLEIKSLIKSAVASIG
jgi:dTDP-4-amino-4,6-dideoxygalactose transaminase